MAELLLFPTLFDLTEPAEPAQPPDSEARQQALDIRRSFIVEAPAGSGKTGLLIQRFLKLLADESVTEPEQVLAVTFTNKATAELRDRVLAHLEAAAHTPAEPASNDFDRQTRAFALTVLERDHQLGWSILDHPHRLNIRTIDSVCAQIARTLPVLSGSGGRLTPAADAEPLHREAARRTLLLFGGGDVEFDRALNNLLLHRDGNLADCESLIANMLALRDQWADLVPITQTHLDDAWLDAEILPRLERALDRAICETLTRLTRIFPPDLLADLTEFAAEIGHLDGYRGQLSPIAECAGLTNSPEAISAHLVHWRALIHLLLTPSGNAWRKALSTSNIRVEYEPRHKARLQSLMDQLNHRDDLLDALCKVRQLPPALYPVEQWAVAKSLFRVLSRALVELQFVFAARNQCDFTELSLLARYALEQDSGADDLAAALGARLQHLLVDEMQDTSTSQYNLIQLLTSSWDGHSQTVFLVGDPRQSIYLFRQARVERFIRAMHTQQLGELPLTRLRLTANFRSQHNLVRHFNQDFELVFPKSDLDQQALPYTAAQPTRPPSPVAAGAVWHTRTLPASTINQTAPQIRQQQARCNATDILSIARDWLSKPLPVGRTKPWTIAILVRNRNHLDEIVAALRKQDPPLPFRAVEIEALNERQEILDLTALTRALLHPADRVAALAVLRAPWCGLSLADLYTLTGTEIESDDPSLKNHSIQRMMQERGHHLPDDSCQRLTRVWNILQAAATQRARLTAAQLVERAWRSLGGDAWLSPPQLANARRFFLLLDELETPAIRIDLTLLEARLRCLYAEPEPVPAGTSFVELLTIHKAKGLEWDVVLVPALERKPAANRPRLLTWSEIASENQPGDTAAHVMLAPIAGRGEESKSLNTWLNALHRTREAAERKRLFYVACTRAREELHLFASPQLTSKGVLNPAADSLLKAAWAAAEPHFADTAAATLIPARPLLLDLAATAAAPSRPILQRLPISFHPEARFLEARAHKLPYGDPAIALDPAHTSFSRPEGSFAARSFGNAVHTCLEILSKRILEGSTAFALLAELPAWTQRIASMLRADGLPRPTIDTLTRDTLTALENTLRDSNGLWLLAPHPHSASEFAITAWPDSPDVKGESRIRPTSVRIDRIFHAGAEPHAPGEDFLWIVDYKTSSHSPTGLEDFLTAQRSTYGPQLEIYARIVAPARSISLDKVRLALYFPTLPRLVWWNNAATLGP